MREFEADFLSKLMAVVDGSHARKMRLTGEDTSAKAKSRFCFIQHYYPNCWR